MKILNKIKESNILKSKYFYVFIAILFLGIFLRSYNFTPWLHFELDQSRDSILIKEVVDDGIGNLPLLGPRAAGSFLRLGPASYYIEYFFSFIMQNSLTGPAFSILFFAILSLPAFFVLFRRYFSTKKTLGLLTLFSVSLFVVTYSRFSWNPNLLPFFILMFFYCLLRVVDKKEEKNGLWLIGAAFFYGILSQFHFLALIIIALTAIIFLIIKRPRVKFHFWIASILVCVFLYTPMIINETKTGWKNTELFVSATSEKSESKRNLLEKFIKNISENSDYSWVILSGSQTAQIPDFDMRKSPDIKCDSYCRSHLWEGVLALIIAISGVIILITKTFTLKTGKKKDFLILNTILLITSFIVFIPLAFDFSARFFLITIPLPFVLLGMVLNKLEDLTKRKWLFFALLALLIISNLFFVNRFFRQLKEAPIEEYQIPTDKVLKQKTRITLEQQNLIVDHIESIHKENGYPVFFDAQPEFHRAFAFIFDDRKIPKDGGIPKEDDDIYEKVNYFIIIRSQSESEDYLQEYLSQYTITNQTKFGTLIVFQLVPKNESITKESPKPKLLKTEIEKKGITKPRRYKWNEVF